VRGGRWPVPLLLGLAFLPCAGAFLPGRILYGRDLHLVFWGQAEAAVRLVASGIFPSWNPWAGFGQPLLANPEAQLLYPLTWLNLLLRPPAYLAVFTFVHLAIAALGARALALRLGASPAAGALAGAVYMLAGPLPALATMWHHFASACLCPWTLEAALDAGLSGRVRAGARWGALIGLQVLAGSGDYASLGALVSGLFALLAARHAAPPGGVGRAFRLGLLAAALGFSVSAPQGLPSLALVAGSGRVEQPDAIRTQWSVHPAALLETVTPGLLATLGPGPLRDQFSYQREPFIDSLYLGVLLAPLVLAGASASRWPSRLLLGLGVGALLLALGRHAPFFAWAAGVPPFSLLRYPVKAMPFAALAWAQLAGLGLDNCRAGAASSRAPLWGLAGVVAVAGAAWPVWGGSPGGSLRLGLSALLLAAAALLGTPRPGWATALAVLGVADLALQLGQQPTAPRALFDYRPALLETLPEGARIYSYDYSLPDRALLHLGRPHGPTLAGIPAGWDFQSAFALGLQDLVAPLTSPRWGLRGSFEIDHRGLYPRELTRLVLLLRLAEGTPAHLRLLQMASVSHVIALHGDGLQDLTPVREMAGVFREPVRLLAVPETLPRVRLVAGARRLDESATLDALLRGPFDARGEVLLPPGGAQAPAGPVPGRTEVLEERADQLVVDADAQAASWLVVADAWAPGWTAAVDDRPAALERANQAFRAVALPPGRHRVVLAYEATGWRPGLALGVAGLLALGICWRLG
jgi:hypothetical protein